MKGNTTVLLPPAPQPAGDPGYLTREHRAVEAGGNRHHLQGAVRTRWVVSGRVLVVRPPGESVPPLALNGGGGIPFIGLLHPGRQAVRGDWPGGRVRGGERIFGEFQVRPRRDCIYGESPLLGVGLAGDGDGTPVRPLTIPAPCCTMECPDLQTEVHQRSKR